MNSYIAVTAACFALAALVLLLRWKLRGSKAPATAGLLHCAPVQLVHRLCPHNNVVQRFQVQEKDSLDEHLDVLTRKLAEKEGRLHISKYKIRETQDEIQSLHAIDHEVRAKYREIMDSLRNDLMANEKECRKLQEQIEWVSRRRAEIRDEVRQGQKLYGEAAVELASNLAELQRGRVTSKPQQRSACSLRLRKQPDLPSACPVHSVRQVQKLYSEAAVELASNLAELQRGCAQPRVTSKPQQRSACSLRLRKQPDLPSACPVHSVTIKSPRSSNESMRVYRTTDS